MRPPILTLAGLLFLAAACGGEATGVTVTSDGNAIGVAGGGAN